MEVAELKMLRFSIGVTSLRQDSEGQRRSSSNVSQYALHIRSIIGSIHSVCLAGCARWDGLERKHERQD